MKWLSTFSLICSGIFLLNGCSNQKTVQIVTDKDISPRIEFAVTRLSEALEEQGYEVNPSTEYDSTLSQTTIVIGLNTKDLLNQQAWVTKNAHKEGYRLQNKANLTIIETGSGMPPGQDTPGIVGKANRNKKDIGVLDWPVIMAAMVMEKIFSRLMRKWGRSPLNFYVASAFLMAIGKRSCWGCL